jgi:peptide/nickel transport system substrate-binding protein
MCWAFPYAEVVDGVFEGYAKRAVGPVAELCRGFDPATFVYSTDLELARTLFRQAGVAEGTVRTLMSPPGHLEASAAAELFQANLATIGLRLEIQSVDFATYVGLFVGDLPADERPNVLPSFWQPDDDDGWSHLWPQVSCAAWQAGNGGRYRNQRVAELLTQARDAVDDDAYQAALSAVQQIVTRDEPAAISYAQTEWPTVLRRDVAGFAPDLVVGEMLDVHALHRQTRAFRPRSAQRARFRAPDRTDWQRADRSALWLTLTSSGVARSLSRDRPGLPSRDGGSVPIRGVV